MSNHERVEQLKRRLREGVLIADGALGTILSRGGRDPGQSLDLLNVENPDVVRAAHRGYVEAGSELILANTFQGNRPSLERHNLADRTAELNTAGVNLAREIAGDDVFVGGDMGPTARILEPYGDYPTERARAAFAPARGPESRRCGGRRNCIISRKPRCDSACRFRSVRYAVSAHTELAVFAASSSPAKLRLSWAAASVTVQVRINPCRLSMLRCDLYPNTGTATSILLRAVP